MRPRLTAGWRATPCGGWNHEPDLLFETSWSSRYYLVTSHRNWALVALAVEHTIQQ
jgi:hypothetical protein